jgi:nitrous oxidase accessory protein
MRLNVTLIFFGLLAAQSSGADLTGWHRPSAALGDLQLRIAALQPGETLVLEEGDHEGPIVIRTPGITLHGKKNSSVRGRGKGSVIVVEADNVTLENFAITGSGDSYDQVDAGIAVRNSKNTVLRQLRISDSLFGIDVANSQGVRIENNKISSKNLDLGLRGDAIRLWASRDVHVLNNFWSDTRDAVSWYSQQVTFAGNEATRSRYSIHSMYSNSLMIEDNHFYGNSVGIFIMYGEGTTLLNNTISQSLGPTGMALGMKETSSLYASGNRFLYCAIGVLVDNSPLQPGSGNWFKDNQIAFNTTGVLFSNGRKGNQFVSNRFESNHTDVDSESRRISESLWENNFWDNYDGFDRDKNGVGDTPFRVLRYFDLKTSTHPVTGFFYGAPVASLVNFVERLLPLTEPVEILRDEKPLFLWKETK